MGSLNELVAMVTGGGSGIGRAIAVAFAREGCSVGVLDRVADAASETVHMIGQSGGRAMALDADVTSAAEVNAAVERLIDEYQRLDILVNNAGIGKLGLVTDLSEGQWDEVMDVNVKGIFLCSRASIPHILKSPHGRVINIASVAGIVASPGRPAYCASKGAVVMLTKAMALDYAREQMTVNAICPGAIDTPMNATAFRDPAVRQEKIDKTPLGRIAAPEEVAHAAVYLAGPGAGFVTGAILPVDGGWTID